MAKDLLEEFEKSDASKTLDEFELSTKKPVIKDEFPTSYEGVREKARELVTPYENLLAKTSTVPVSAVRSLTTMSTDPIVAELTSQTPTEEGSFSKDLGQIAGPITDIAVGGLIGSGLNKLAPLFQEKAIEHTAESLVSGNIPKSMKQELLSAPRQVGQQTEIRKVAETADRFGLIPYITDKTKMLRKLTGEIVGGKKVSTGIIGEKTSDLASAIRKASGETNFLQGEKDLIPSIADDIKNTFRRKYSPTMSGAAYNPSVENSMVNEVDSFLKPKTSPYSKKVFTPKSTDRIETPLESRKLNRQFEEMNPTIDELVSLKRKAQAKAYEQGKLAEQGVETAKDKHEIYNQIWRSIDAKIYSIAEGIDASKGTSIAPKIRRINSDISELMDLHNIIEDAPIHKSASFFENVAGAGATAAGLGAVGVNPLYGAAYPLARKLGGSAMSNIPGAMAAGEMEISNALKSVSPPAMALAATMQIPMSTSKAMNDPEGVYSKISQDFGPQQAELFKSARSVEQVRALFRTLHLQNPQAFEQTKYNNIDGYIDPAFKQQAINDIVKDKESPSQNALKMETLLHEGKIIGE